MSPRAWVVFAAVSVVWGMPYVFIKIAVEGGVEPTVVAFARVALAAAVLLPIAWRLGALGPMRGRMTWIAVFAVCEIVLPFPLIAAAEQWVSSSLAAILVAALPLMIAVMAIRFDEEERVRGARLIGLFVGLGGVVLLLGIDVAGQPRELLGAGCILLGLVGYAAGPMVIKRRLSDVPPLGAIASAMLVSTILLAPAAALQAPTRAPAGDALAALVILGLVCTAAAFLLYFVLITEIGPSRASVITYVNPIVAVTLGITLLGESIGFAAIAGLLLILAGSWLATGGGGPSGLAAALKLRSHERRARRVRAAGTVDAAARMG